MKKYSNYLLTLTALLFLYSCKNCDDSITCPPFSADLEQYLVYNENDVIKFKNDDGIEISFVVNIKNLSGAFTADSKNGPFGCQPPTLFSDCRPVGYYSGITENGERIINDTANNRIYNYNNLEYRISTRLTNDLEINSIRFELMDIQGFFQYTPEIKLEDRQVILPKFKAGNETYFNVILQRKDLEKNDRFGPPTNTDFISEVYIQPSIGIIAFFDLQTNSLFYLNK